MKTLGLILITSLVIIHIGCQTKESPNVFNSKKLEGKYIVDLSPFVEEALNTTNASNEVAKLANAMAALALSSVKVEMDFHKENTGVMRIEGSLLDFVSAVSDSALQNVHSFSYQVKRDSMLYMKFDDEKHFSRWGVIKKYSNSYDRLQFLVTRQGQEPVYFNLNKTKK